MSREHVSHLLLVEDNAQDADLLRFLIERSEFDAHITQVIQLKEAISACQYQQFDVVLLDLNLPDSQGEETAAEFCSFVKDLPVLVLSGLPEQEMGNESIALGAQDYLAKDDLTSTQLVRAIRYSMRRQAVRMELMQRNDDLFEELDRQIQQSRIKLNFIAAATHHIKGPLNLVSVCLEALQTANAEPNVQQRRSRLVHMEKAIAVMFDFLDAIQVTSAEVKPQASCSPVELVLEPFCQDVIADVALTVTAAADDNLQANQAPVNQAPVNQASVTQARIALQIDIEEEALLLDPTLLRYVLSNLLNNAVKYSPPEERITLNVSKDETWVKFEICDRGIGIPRDEQQRIFSPFYRATNARIAQSGSGLGLAIVRTCVELHHGQLAIDSALGQGTRVSVHLPLKLATPSVGSRAYSLESLASVEPLERSV